MVAVGHPGHASGWFFQYPGVPVPGCGVDVGTNPKLFVLVPFVTSAELNGEPLLVPMLSGPKGEGCVPVGICTYSVKVSGNSPTIEKLPSRSVVAVGLSGVHTPSHA